MKSDKMFDALGNIDDNLINEYESSINHNKHNKIILIRWIKAAACFCIICAAAIIIYPKLKNIKPFSADVLGTQTITEKSSIKTYYGSADNTTNYHGTTAATNGNSNASESPQSTEIFTSTNASDSNSGENYYIKKWSERTNIERYGELQFNSISYGSYGDKTDSKYINNTIGTGILKGYDVYDEKNYTTSCNVYSIKSIPEDFAVAVKFKGESIYYIYILTDYSPKTLNELFKNMGLDKYLEMTNTDYIIKGQKTKYNITDIDDSFVKKIIFSNRLQNNIFDDNSQLKIISNNYVEITVSIPALGIYNKAIMISDSGDVFTNIANVGFSYKISETDANTLISYIMKNGTKKSIDYYPKVFNGNEKTVLE